MLRKPITALVGALLIVGAFAVPAGAKAGDIVVKNRCSLGAKAKLKAAPRASNARTKIEFEVDSNVNGQVWDVSITDRGATVLATARTTTAPSGSFTARAKVPGASGHQITATARDRASGQTCSIAASV
jgi:hypothetical protein